MIQPYDYSQTLQGVDRIARLLDEEHSIIEFYATTISALTEAHIAPTLEALKRSHQRNASELQYALYIRGDAPSPDRLQPPREPSFERARRSAASSMQQALERESDLQALYEAAMLDGGLDAAIKELVERCLLPRVAANATVLTLVENRILR